MSEQPNPLTHSVFFQLKDPTAENCEQLVESCYSLLGPTEGWLSLHAGVRDEELTRPVNDQDFHVALTIIFESRAAHDVYQTHENHLKFLELNKENWASVRIFDATVRP
jgi:hypothetical protein